MGAERDRRLTVGSGLFLVLLVLGASLTYYSVHQLRQDMSAAAYTADVVDALADLSFSVADAEAGQWAAVLTGEERYRESVAFILVAINRKMERVRELTENKPRQQARFRELRGCLSSQLRALARLTAAKRAKADAARLVALTDEWQRDAGATRTLVGAIAQDEEDHLRALEPSSQRAYLLALMSGLLMAFLVVFAAGALVRQRQHDNTLRRQAAAQTHELQELLQAVLSRSDEGVIATDSEGSVTLLNPTAQTLTGWTPDEALGKHLDVVFRIVQPTTRRAVDHSALGALRWGRLVSREEPALLIARDGREWLVEDSAVPLRREDGKARGALLVFREIRMPMMAAFPTPATPPRAIRHTD
jgi:PAS domain S-box-containing protein